MSKKERVRHEEVIPKACICKRMPVMVKKRGWVMWSCPNPCRCPGNMRSQWARSTDEAAVFWNNSIWAFR